ncbi:MAG: ATP synthase F0 subunit B [Desulfovibrio sp.]|nr:ATP synthase F0 subunit B [Desulfovibrio sp.]
MLDLNITLLIQLGNFFIALFFLNLLLIRPIREIIRKRKGIMDGMADEAGSFEHQASERLANYEAELDRARQDATGTREESRAQGQKEQQEILAAAQQKARDMLNATRASLQAQATEALNALRKESAGMATSLTQRLVNGQG